MKQADDIKQVLLDYGHWGALAVSSILIIIFVFMGFDPKAEKKKKDIIKRKKAVEISLKRKKEKGKKLPDYSKELKGNWSILDIKTKTVGAEVIYPEAKIAYKEAIPPTKQWINVPQNLKISVEMEKIILTWDQPATKYNSKGEPEKMTKIDGYHLLKKWKGGQKIIEMSDTDNVYEDKDLETRVEYKYRVRAYTLNTKAQGGNKIAYKGENIVVSDYTGAQQGTILPKYKIELSSVAGETAYIKLQKWEKGDWRTASFFVKKGEKIECKKNVSGYGNVYFNPGWKLLHVKPNIKKYKIVEYQDFLIDPKTKKIQKDQDGKPIKVIKKKRRAYFIAGIQYMDEKGVTRILFQKRK